MNSDLSQACWGSWTCSLSLLFLFYSVSQHSFLHSLNQSINQLDRLQLFLPLCLCVFYSIGCTVPIMRGYISSCGCFITFLSGGSDYFHSTKQRNCPVSKGYTRTLVLSSAREQNSTKTNKPTSLACSLVPGRKASWSSNKWLFFPVKSGLERR